MRKCRQKDLTGCNQSVVGTAPNSSLNSEMKANKAGIEDFLTAFEKTTDTLTEFSVEAFSSLVEFIAVYSEKDIRVTFRNGQEIKA